MDTAAYLALALKLVPDIIDLGEDVAAFISRILTVYDSDYGPTEADWDALHKLEAELRAKLG